MWSYDFVSTRTHDGPQCARFSNLIDEFTRECLMVRAERRWSSAKGDRRPDRRDWCGKASRRHLRSDKRPGSSTLAASTYNTVRPTLLARLQTTGTRGLADLHHGGMEKWKTATRFPLLQTPRRRILETQKTAALH